MRLRENRIILMVLLAVFTLFPLGKLNAAGISFTESISNNYEHIQWSLPYVADFYGYRVTVNTDYSLNPGDWGVDNPFFGSNYDWIKNATVYAIETSMWIKVNDAVYGQNQVEYNNYFQEHKFSNSEVNGQTWPTAPNDSMDYYVHQWSLSPGDWSAVGEFRYEATFSYMVAGWPKLITLVMTKPFEYTFHVDSPELKPDPHIRPIFIDKPTQISLNLKPDAVPEPATILLFSFGLIGLTGVRRKFKK